MSLEEWEMIQAPGAEEDPELYIRSSGSPSPASAPSGPAQAQIALDRVYSDALEQAQELLQDTDPRATKEDIANICRQMAQNAVQEEIATRHLQHPAGEKPKEPTPPLETVPHEVPLIKASRRRRGEEATGSSPAAAPTKEETSLEPGHHWHRFVQNIQGRKRWSARGTMMNYSKNGMPRSIHGPARGQGHHIGRWGWREISPWW